MFTLIPEFRLILSQNEIKLTGTCMRLIHNFLTGKYRNEAFKMMLKTSNFHRRKFKFQKLFSTS